MASIDRENPKFLAEIQRRDRLDGAYLAELQANELRFPDQQPRAEVIEVKPLKLPKAEFQALSRAKQVSYVKQMLENNDTWLLKGLVRIYERQTATEKCADQTQDQNGVGFGAFDAEFLSSSAKRALSGYPLSTKHLTAIRKAMKKYAGQLVRIARGEA